MSVEDFLPTIVELREANGGKPPTPGAVQEVFGCSLLEALDILKNCCEEPPKKRSKKDKKSKEVSQAAEPEARRTAEQIVPADPSLKDGVKSGSAQDIADTLVQPETPQASPLARLQSQRRGCIVYIVVFFLIADYLAGLWTPSWLDKGHFVGSLGCRLWTPMRNLCMTPSFKTCHGQFKTR